MQLKHHVTGKLLTRDYNLLIRDAVQRFNRYNLSSASHAELVGVLTGYEFIHTDRQCGGFCNGWDKVIALRDSDVPPGSVTTFAELPINKGMVDRFTLLHEIGHALQFKNGDVEIEPLLSKYLRMEHQVESIAYRMYTGMYGPINPDYFSSYQTREQKEFLRDWYGTYLANDILL